MSLECKELRTGKKKGVLMDGKVLLTGHKYLRQPFKTNNIILNEKIYLHRVLVELYLLETNLEDNGSE